MVPKNTNGSPQLLRDEPLRRRHCRIAAHYLTQYSPVCARKIRADMEGLIRMKEGCHTDNKQPALERRRQADTVRILRRYCLGVCALISWCTATPAARPLRVGWRSAKLSFLPRALSRAAATFNA